MARSSALAPNPARRSRCSMYGDPRAMRLYLLGAGDMIGLPRLRRISDFRQAITFLWAGHAAYPPLRPDAQRQTHGRIDGPQIRGRPEPGPRMRRCNPPAAVCVLRAARILWDGQGMGGDDVAKMRKAGRVAKASRSGVKNKNKKKAPRRRKA